MRAVYERFAAAFRAKDVNAVMEVFAPGGELFVFDLPSDGRQAGLNEHKKYYQAFFADLPASIDDATIHGIGFPSSLSDLGTSGGPIHAIPISPGQTGERYFFTDESVVIRANGLSRATKSDPPI